MAKILLIDDDPQTVDLVELILSSGGHQVSTLGDGAQAFAKVRELRPELILLDVMLPGLDGYSIEAKLLEDPETQNIPVIIMTAKYDMADKLRGARNVAHFIPKPFVVKELLQKVQATLESK